MREKIKYLLIGVVFTCIAIACLDRCGHDSEYKVLSRDSTSITIIDSTRYVEPDINIEIDLGAIAVPIRDIDTCFIYNTDTLYLPLTQRFYSTSEYKAWISGYNPKLDSIVVFSKTITNTIKEVIQKQKKWEISAYMGSSFGVNSVMPYLGVEYSRKRWALNAEYGYDVINKNGSIQLGVEYKFLRFGR